MRIRNRTDGGEMTIAGLLDQVAMRFAQRPAVSFAGTTLSYRELNGRAAGLARSLRHGVGLSGGDRVGLAMENSGAFFVGLFAIWRAGLVAVPMNAKLHAREFAGMLSDCGAALCLASPKQAAALAQFQPECPVMDVAGRHFDELQHASPLDPANQEPGALAWIFYTSGTTGKPKGAMLSHRNLLFAAQAYLSDIDHLDERHTMLHAAPLSHGAGLYALPHLLCGSHQVVLSGSFDAEAVIEAILDHESVSMFAAPTMVARLVSALEHGSTDIGNLRTLIYGGAPMYVSDLKRAHAALDGKLYQLYGQGESPMTISGLDQRRHAIAIRDGDDNTLASCGFARTGVAVRIVDGDDNSLPAGSVGEVATRSDCVMSGYWGDEAATHASLRKGWLRTGDIGEMSEKGLLTLRDRSKDVIISGGTNIYPREVEEVLLTHPRVREAAVLGKADREWGEKVVACVVSSGEDVRPEELDALCLERLARFKRPREYIFLEDLPKNSYGKIVKRDLRVHFGEI